MGENCTFKFEPPFMAVRAPLAVYVKFIYITRLFAIAAKHQNIKIPVMLFLVLVLGPWLF